MIEIEEEIRFIDLFGGVGGFRLGLERANENNRSQSDLSQRWNENGGSPQSLQSARSDSITKKTSYKCVWYNDSDKYAVQTYNKNFGESHIPADIRKVKAESIPSFQLLCAGFPCQSFSIAGKRKGFEDTRGTLFFEICRIVGHHRPRLLLLENVKNAEAIASAYESNRNLRNLGR